ncbi:quinone oxidoreductase family protein [Flavimaricola marinus]|uniref:Quinone oxidoreductase 1 n=1 Tax=Flavimaricola marinus TaxID=1819565 RepID=A0A238LGD6_9RHOB|nr:quinone oxidoreductase [Flavimaricola marinus]SMY08026.1 Quinone oxidoreductase 1 [Flavimaricola marinus]
METTRVVIRVPGGPDALEFETIDLPPPGPGEVQLEQTAIGLNYLDTYQRSGAIPLPLPAPMGTEAAGRVVAVGDGVDLQVGDRVAYAMLPGSYATHRNVPAARMVKLPDGISDEVAAATLLKGLTVSYLMGRTYKVQKGDPVLFWAASGGVGQLAGQWGADLGAEMIGVTGGAANCALIKELGYAHALDRNTDDIAARVREITGGKGVPVVYDSVGAASFDASLASLAPMGMFVNFGATTGQPPPVAALTLQNNGSLFFTRPTLLHYMAARADLEHAATELFDRLLAGTPHVNINARRPLSEIAEAHTALESGTTTGSTVLIP